jgi:hypothetical protein
MVGEHDPVQNLIHALAECRRCARAAQEQISELEPRFSDIEPGLAKGLARIRSRLDDLDPDFTMFLDELESGSDPSRWFWKQTDSTH